MSRPHTPATAPGRRVPSGSHTGQAGTSRSATPTLGRPTITIDEWERMAPLKDSQLEKLNSLKDKYAQRPFPEKFTKAPAEPRPSTPPAVPRPARLAHLLASPSPSRNRNRSRPPSTPGSPAPPGGAGGNAVYGSSSLAASQTNLALSVDPIHPIYINTPQQFLDHFGALTLSTEHEQDSLYREHLAEVVALREKCEELIELLETGQGEISEMLKCLEYVEERSESLRGACEDLLEEQTHLLTHTSHLAHRLTFFTFLETAQNMLNTPSHNLVTSEDFLPMVKRLEECLTYLGEHRDFKDSELYLIRYQQCMTRSMTLIKIYFVNTIRALGQEVSKKLYEKQLGETATQALLYTKFASLSATMRPLVAELENRSFGNPDELASLLAECHGAWVTTRQSLLGSRVSAEIAHMEPNRTDLVELTRAGCSYLKQTCLDEFHLFKDFFLSGESQLYGFLESLCDYLYDHLRPRILHEPSLETLCAVCTVLQALMVQDVSDLDDNDEVIYTPDNSTPGYSPFGYGEPEGDYFAPHKRSSPMRGASYASTPRQSSFAGTPTGGRMILQQQQRKKRKPLNRLHTEVLLKMVLQDAQTRLVFRAQALISADVAYYAAKEGDLDYPDKLPGGKDGGLPSAQRQASITLDDDDEDEPGFLSLPPPDAQTSWYPPLRVTLWVLSCLYSYVDAAVFEDLAQEAIVTCRQSLSAAADLVGARKDKSIDGRLFLVRHLLILKEMTAGLELNRGTRRKEWAGITDFLRSLLENATSILGYSKGSIVRPAEMATDAKTDVDRELKRACEDLIGLCVRSSTEPISTYLDKCTNYLTSRMSPNPANPSNGTAADLSTQSFATPDKVKTVHDEFKKDVVGKMEEWKGVLQVYLPDQETVQVLVPPARNAIVDAYRQFHDLVRAEYDFSTAASIMTPTALATLLSSSI